MQNTLLVRSPHTKAACKPMQALTERVVATGCTIHNRLSGRACASSGTFQLQKKELQVQRCQSDRLPPLPSGDEYTRLGTFYWGAVATLRELCPNLALGSERSLTAICLVHLSEQLPQAADDKRDVPEAAGHADAGFLLQIPLFPACNLWERGNRI